MEREAKIDKPGATNGKRKREEAKAMTKTKVPDQIVQIQGL